MGGSMRTVGEQIVFAHVVHAAAVEAVGGQCAVMIVGKAKERIVAYVYAAFVLRQGVNQGIMGSFDLAETAAIECLQQRKGTVGPVILGQGHAPGYGGVLIAMTRRGDEQA